MSKTVFVKLFGLLVTFSKGLLRNHTAADGTVDVVVKRDPLEFVLNKQCQSNIDCVSSASFLMIVCPDAVSVAADTVAIQPLFSYSAKSTITKYIKGQTEIYWLFQFRAKGQSHKPFQK